MELYLWFALPKRRDECSFAVTFMKEGWNVSKENSKLHEKHFPASTTLTENAKIITAMEDIHPPQE
jgi:hypothetical protein